MNILWADTETTGLSCRDAAIIDLACIPVVNGVQQEPLQSNIRPFAGAKIEDKALEINKIDRDMLSTYPDSLDVLNKFINYIASFNVRFALGGHNIDFDKGFIYQMFCRYGVHHRFNEIFTPVTICTLTKARERKKYLPCKMNLSSLCAHFGIEIAGAHTALGDITATIKLNDCLDTITTASQQRTLEQQAELTYAQKRNIYMGSRYVQINANGDVYITADATKQEHILRFICEELLQMYATH